MNIVLSIIISDLYSADNFLKFSFESSIQLLNIMFREARIPYTGSCFILLTFSSSKKTYISSELLWLFFYLSFCKLWANFERYTRNSILFVGGYFCRNVISANRKHLFWKPCALGGTLWIAQRRQKKASISLLNGPCVMQVSIERHSGYIFSSTNRILTYLNMQILNKMVT